MVHSTRTLLSETASQMWAAAGQFFSGVITTKPPVESSEGLWGKRWGVGERGDERKRREEITTFENLLNLISLVDFIYGGLYLTFNNYF